MSVHIGGPTSWFKKTASDDAPAETNGDVFALRAQTALKNATDGTSQIDDSLASVIDEEKKALEAFKATTIAQVKKLRETIATTKEQLSARDREYNELKDIYSRTKQTMFEHDSAAAKREAESKSNLVEQESKYRDIQSQLDKEQANGRLLKSQLDAVNAKVEAATVSDVVAKTSDNVIV